MRVRFWLLLGVAPLGCRATIPESEHRAALSAQQTDYEHRLRRAEEARKRAEQGSEEQAVDGIQRRQALLERIQALESALAQKQRLWDESVRGDAAKSAPEPASLARSVGALLETTVSAERDGTGVVLRIPLDLFFEPGSVQIRAEVEARLPALAKALGGRGDHRIELRVGSDDLRPVGEGPGLLDLTAQQAASLAEALVRGGLDPSLLRATGLGGGAPVADNESAEGRAANRRLELRLEPLGRGTRGGGQRPSRGPT